MHTHAPAQGKLLLDADALGRTLSRIAHEIIEGNPNLDQVALVGIQTRGVPIAQRLARLIGPSKAKDLIFTGRMVKADEARELGLVDRVVAADQVYAEAMKLAETLARGPTAALAAAKAAIDAGLDEPLADGLRREGAHFAALFDTEDQKTGMRSFLHDGPGKARFAGR